MGRVRSARALNLLMPLAGERFSGVRATCAGGNIWGGIFDPRERGRRGGPQGCRKARGGELERTLGCGSRAWRLRGAGENKAERKWMGACCEQIDHAQSLLWLSLSCCL